MGSRVLWALDLDGSYTRVPLRGLVSRFTDVGTAPSLVGRAATLAASYLTKYGTLPIGTMAQAGLGKDEPQSLGRKRPEAAAEFEIVAVAPQFNIERARQGPVHTYGAEHSQKHYTQTAARQRDRERWTTQTPEESPWITAPIHG